MLERRLRDVESNKQRVEAELAKQEILCEQLRQANEQLALRVDNTPKDFEREKQLLQSQYQGEINALRKRLQEGDEDMDRVRLAEQNQRLQLLDEVSAGRGAYREPELIYHGIQLNSAQEKIDKLNMQLRARGG
jgi:cupin superfamily acireductone dioxygenase involved in methionine salvage